MRDPDASAILEEFVRTGDVRLLAEAIPYAKFLGMSCIESEDGAALGKMTYSPELIGNSAIPALHGGTVGALLESACQFAVVKQMRIGRVPKVVTLTVDFMRSGKAQDTFARATITRLGRRIANVHAVAWQDDETKPIASAHAIVLISAADAAKGAADKA